MITENEWFIKVPWGRLCVMAWGDCYDPPILLCNGEELSVASFRLLVQDLPKKFYYIGVEFPGTGRSDAFPPGMPINAHDMAYVIALIVKHFRWTEFGCIACSLAVHYAKIYNLCHPGVMNKLVELDPAAFYGSVITVEQFSQWYHKNIIDFFKNYKDFNMPKEKGPSYTKEQAVQILIKNGLDKQAAVTTLSRISEPVGNNRVRFTFDRRTQLVTLPPYTTAQAESLFANLTTSTLSIVTESSVKQGTYALTSYALNESEHAAGNYRVRIVPSLDKGVVYVSQFLLFGLDGLDRPAKL